MARESFAPPASELAKPALGSVEVASAPSAGQGFALNAQGHLPVTSTTGNWTMEAVSASHDPPSIAAGSFSTETIVLPAGSCAVGDLLLFQGSDGLETGLDFSWFEPVCTVADRARVRFRNPTGSAVNDDERVYHWLVIRRSVNQ